MYTKYYSVLIDINLNLDRKWLLLIYSFQTSDEYYLGVWGRGGAAGQQAEAAPGVAAGGGGGQGVAAAGAPLLDPRQPAAGAAGALPQGEHGAAQLS